MKIKLENKIYEIDLEKAKSIGLCKECNPEITSIELGDVFYCPKGMCSTLIIMPYGWTPFYENASYFLAGLDGGLSPFSNRPMDAENMIKYLNERELVKIGNLDSVIRSEIIKLKSAQKHL